MEIKHQCLYAKQHEQQWNDIQSTPTKMGSSSSSSINWTSGAGFCHGSSSSSTHSIKSSDILDLQQKTKQVSIQMNLKI